MRKSTQIRIAGSITAFFFVFHFFFYWMFDWGNTLSCLSKQNYALLLSFNIVSIGLFGMMAFISLFQTQEMHSTGTGTVFLIFSSLLYWFRIVAEFTLFGIQNSIGSAIIIILCAIPAIFYATPLIPQKEDKLY